MQLFDNTIASNIYICSIRDWFIHEKIVNLMESITEMKPIMIAGHSNPRNEPLDS